MLTTRLGLPSPLVHAPRVLGVSDAELRRCVSRHGDAFVCRALRVVLRVDVLVCLEEPKLPPRRQKAAAEEVEDALQLMCTCVTGNEPIRHVSARQWYGVSLAVTLRADAAGVHRVLVAGNCPADVERAVLRAAQYI